VSFLLDTNVVSEWTKRKPNTGVVALLATEDEDALFLSVVTLAELRRGVDRLVLGRRRSRLDDWLRSDLPARFAGRLLGIDAATADAWGRLIARRERDGRPMGVMHGWLAATAEVHGLTLVTRDVVDFAGTLQRIVCPWSVD
jgi:predicted nucleic acid-binding protein